MFTLVVMLAITACCAQSVWREALWKTAEPRIMSISRVQQEEGLIRSATFAGMPFLEQPPLYFDLTALAFEVAGEPSILAARIVVALLGLAWVVSMMLMARHAAGKRAALLAGVMVTASGAFLALVRHLGVDICLVSMLSIALLCTYRAVATDAERVGGRWWWAALIAAGCAAMSKGLFGTFLFVVPTLAYAALARDGRMLRALFRPATLGLLVLPHALWALVLYRDGGMTFVFEHFVNNTIGRVLHVRFEVEGVADLAYGDVGVAYPWHYFLQRVPYKTLPASVMVPFAILWQLRRGGFRERDPVSRLMALALCWGLVPPLILSFSTYKGRGHLAAGLAALVVIGAIELARRLPDLVSPSVPRWAQVSVVITFALAPLLVVAAFFGQPATANGAHVAFAVAGAAGLLGLIAAIRTRRLELAVWSLLAALTVVLVVDSSPGNVARDTERRTLDPVAVWVAEQVGDQPVAVYRSQSREGPDLIGRANDQVMGALSFWLGRPPRRLPTPESVTAFLESEVPGYLFVGRKKNRPLDWPRGKPGVGWVAVGGNRDEAFLLVANRAAAATHPAPTRPPPDVVAR